MALSVPRSSDTIEGGERTGAGLRCWWRVRGASVCRATARPGSGPRSGACCSIAASRSGASVTASARPASPSSRRRFRIQRERLHKPRSVLPKGRGLTVRRKRSPPAPRLSTSEATPALTLTRRRRRFRATAPRGLQPRRLGAGLKCVAGGCALPGSIALDGAISSPSVRGCLRRSVALAAEMPPRAFAGTSERGMLPMARLSPQGAGLSPFPSPEETAGLQPTGVARPSAPPKPQPAAPPSSHGGPASVVTDGASRAFDCQAAAPS